MNSRALFALVLGGLIVGGIYSYPWLSWKYWHWKNHHILRLQGYEVRVPDRFLVGRLHDDTAILVDNAPRPVNGRVIPSQITFLRTRPDPQLRANLSIEEKIGQSSKTLLPIETIAGEKARCVTDDVLARTTHNNNLVSGDCVTEGGLLILFGGMKDDLPDLLNVVNTTTRAN